MKKVIITAMALVLGATAFGQTNQKSELEFNRYLAKKISNFSSFGNEGVQGTVQVKMSISPEGVTSVNVISGVNPKIDEEVVAWIKNTPAKIVSKLAEEKQKQVIVPVKLVIQEN